MTDRWSPRELPTKSEKMGFANAPPDDLQCGRQKLMHPYVPLPGYYRKKQALNGHDDYGDFLTWEQLQTNGASYISDFMSLSGNQTNVILNDFTTAQGTGTDMQAIQDEIAYYAGVSNVGPKVPGQTIQEYMGIILPVLLGADDWAKYQPKWNALSASVQQSIGQQYMNSRLTPKPMSRGDVETAIDNGGKQVNIPVPEEVAIIIGAAAVLGLGLYVLMK